MDHSSKRLKMEFLRAGIEPATLFDRGSSIPAREPNKWCGCFFFVGTSSSLFSTRWIRTTHRMVGTDYLVTLACLSPHIYHHQALHLGSSPHPIHQANNHQ